MRPESDRPVTLDYVDASGAPVAILTLNRPVALNALNEAMLLALDDALDRVEQSPDVSVMVITGAGKAFSAGGDMKAYMQIYADRSAYRDLLNLMARVFARIEQCPLVSVAMINGSCIAGGLELALCCDLVTVADEASIGDGHLQYWQLPGAGGTNRLIRSVGLATARHLLLTAATVSASTAVERGLAVLAAPSDELLGATLALIADIARRPRDVNAQMKALISHTVEGNAAAILQREREHVIDYVTTSNSRAMQGLELFRSRPRVTEPEQNMA
jgi:enoyl-CoA hydratase/carnithine racemase